MIVVVLVTKILNQDSTVALISHLVEGSFHVKSTQKMVDLLKFGVKRTLVKPKISASWATHFLFCGHLDTANFVHFQRSPYWLNVHNSVAL